MKQSIKPNLVPGNLIVSLFLVVFSTAFSYAQQVTGTVTSSNGKEPLIGVSVLIKGTKTATVTDIAGRFTLNANEKAVLIFSYLGFVSKEVLVGNQKVINVSLDANTENLQEVVVVGYGGNENAI